MNVNVGQHLVIGFPGRELNPANRRLLGTVQPGGVVLFARNVGTAAELRALCDGLRSRLPHRPVIAMDQEGGHVNRLRSIIGETPTIADWKKLGAVDRVRDCGLETAARLRELGVDLDLAPVFDLELFDEKTDNALRGRCWGSTAEEVIRWAGAFLDGLQQGGVAACPKHFPGLGAARLDSHENLPTIARSRELMLAEDLRPYAELLPRLPAIMVGHACYPAWDGAGSGRPASLSPAIMTDLLRTQMKYSGLVLTDDMEMGAIEKIGSFEQAIVGAVNAGADMVLVCHRPEKILAAHTALTKAVEQGRIAPDRLAESQERIRRFRERWMGE